MLDAARIVVEEALLIRAALLSLRAVLAAGVCVAIARCARLLVPHHWRGNLKLGGVSV